MIFSRSRRQLAALGLAACAASCSSDASQTNKEIVYTPLQKCVETVENANAAFSELKCPDVGSYELTVTQQSPVYFTVHLQKQGRKLSTEFESITGELPLEPGKTLEWHLVNDEPQFLIFRLAWGTEAAPFKMSEHLVVSYVGQKEICALASIDAKKNRDANQKARDLVSETFSSVRSCPQKILQI